MDFIKFISLTLCLLILQVWGFSSCSKHPANNSLPTLSVDVHNVDKNFNASTLFAQSGDHLLLKLETTNDCVIGEVSNVFIRKDLIFIVDKIAKSIFQFDLTGAFIRKIGKVGRATNEYIDITDVFIDDDMIYVLDHISQKILMYDFDGHFSKMIYIKHLWGHNIAVKNDKIYMINKWSNSSSGRYRLFVIDKNGDIVAKGLPFKSKDLTRRYSEGVSCAVSSNSINVCYPSDNIVYSITEENECVPNIVMDFKNESVPEKLERVDVMEAVQLDVQDKYIWGLDGIALSTRYLFLSYFYNGDKFNTIYDKKLHTYFNVKNLHTTDFYSLPITKYSISSDYVVSYVDANMFKITYEYVIKERLKVDDIYRTRVESIVNNIGLNDNGVLVLYKLKGLTDE
jgi:hypothetical protein